MPVARGSAVAVLGLLLLHSSPAAAMQQSPEPVPRVALGAVKAPPGTSVMTPLSFTPDPGTPLRAITLGVEYVSNSLHFETASRGLAAEMANAEVRTSLSERPPDENGIRRAILRITISVPEARSPAVLPDGVLAYLVFHIAEDAKPFTIRLTPVEVAAEDRSIPPGKVATVSTDPGSITIEKPEAGRGGIAPELNPEVGCFFFTH